MILTNQIIAFHSIQEVLLAKAAEGRLTAHLQQITRFHLSMLLTN
jgi:flagellar assembly factor FliW